jgi:trk system potassium uptake protein TrkH
MTCIGALAAISLVLAQGFSLGLIPENRLFIIQLGLSFLYVTHQGLMLWRAEKRREQLKRGKFEYGILATAVLLAIGLTVSDPISSSVLRFLHSSSPDRLMGPLVQLFLLANVLLQLLRMHYRLLVHGLRAEWTLVGSFAMLILSGTLLLLLPRASASSNSSLSGIDALFTSTSAVCVTGLSVCDTGTSFSAFGLGIILALIQTGGLGIMSFVAFLAVTSSESLPVAQMLAFKQIINARSVAALKRQVWAIVGFSFFVEGIGALCLFYALPSTIAPLNRAAWSVFHAVSAFCNAGFALQSDSLIAYQTNSYVLVPIMLLILLGGLGFLVVNDLFGLQIARLPFFRRVAWLQNYYQGTPVYHLPLQTRLAVRMTIALLLAGFVGFWCLEAKHLLHGQPWATQAWIAAFQSVTARTAGFNTVLIDQMQPATLLLLIALMVVGASPVSTGGGIKTVTFAVLLLSLRAMVIGRDKVEILGCTLPQRVLIAALGVFVLYVITASIGVFSLTLTDPNLPMRAQAFEVISALSTVGLSTGITSQLGVGGKLVLCIVMFVGRLGPVALVLAVFRMGRAKRFDYPEEELVVG